MQERKHHNIGFAQSKTIYLIPFPSPALECHKQEVRHVVLSQYLLSGRKEHEIEADVLSSRLREN